MSNVNGGEAAGVNSGRLGAAGLPSVGIVWGVRDGAGPLLLVTDCTPLAAAEPYGDFLTHPGGHHNVWEGWRRLGPAGLARRGLPRLIAWHEYEHFPRGRVVFNTATRRFTFHADRKLWAPGVLHKMLRVFGLDAAQCTVRPDPHYQTSKAQTCRRLSRTAPTLSCTDKQQPSETP